MAMLKNLSALMILSVITVALLPRATFSIVGNGKSPDCAKGMTTDCGFQLFQIIVFANITAPTNECCHELVKVGKNCNDQFVQFILSTHKPGKGTVSDLYKRSNETWNNCVAATHPKPAH
ncbi:protein DOWN-REGULATED IN DIF1 11-like [Rhodamnia argentea]|uniref:Protein DOWN-REGULATED IN DIF1 11-like n=1 Tax=Rhodamnia argentea TaxID=178133 RepID=A0A8B8QS13_9MYRT|nr:protein DOWN-REGULATED IN DIF1 11-like [Rhodamnia argentea]